MPPTIFVKSNDQSIKAEREATARRVIAEFGNTLPDETLLCCFDDEDWKPFKSGKSAANRGLYRPTEGGGYSNPNWPEYVMSLLFGFGQQRFDHVLYLHDSTCRDRVGLTVTFAHELQHFRQYCRVREMSDAGVLLMTFIGQVPEATTDALSLTRWIDVPHEREARIVSKRIAVGIFGDDSVREFLDRSIASAVNDGDKEDLTFVQRIGPADYSYDLSAATKLVFSRLIPHRRELEESIKWDQTGRLQNINLDSLLSGSV